MSHQEMIITLLGMLLGASEYLGSNPKIASNSVFQVLLVIIKNVYQFMTGKQA